MVRLIILLVALGVASLGAAPALAASFECGSASSALGCPNVSGKVTEQSVVVSGAQSSPGTDSNAGPGSGSPPAPADGIGRGLGPLQDGGGVRYDPVTCSIMTRNDPICLPDEPGESTPAITIRDLASFVPTPGRQQMQPDGWTVAGLDTNFYAITEQHVVAGTLLGRPAEVRFTPTAFHWDYGDGAVATKGTKGGTWAALGIDEFDPTPTSHVYERLDDYTISLSIAFAAEYRFDGSPWRAVVGEITLPANDLHLRVGTAKTVLVEHDCLANPAGPGC